MKPLLLTIIIIAAAMELASESHGQERLPQSGKDRFLVADSITLIKLIASDDLSSGYCLARITPRKGASNVHAVGDITIIKSLSSGESGIDATYDQGVNGYFHYDRPTRWLPYRYSTNPNPVTVLLLGPASMFHGHLRYFPPMMYIYTPWLDLLPSLLKTEKDQPDDLSTILNKPMLSDFDLLHMLTILKKDPSLFRESNRDKILSLEAKTHGYPRAILVGTLIDLVNWKDDVMFATQIDKDQMGLITQVTGPSNSLNDSDLYMIALGLLSSQTMIYANPEVRIAMLSPILMAAQRSPANYPMTRSLLKPSERKKGVEK